MKHQDIYSYVQSEMANFQVAKVPVVEKWDWNMYEHIRNTVIYKYGQFTTGKNDNKPNKNIILPLLRLRYRTEGFDLKDIELYVDDDDNNRWKSFILRKFHEFWARKHKLDTFIDKQIETDIDFGGVLLKEIPGEIKPEIVDWQRIAFCDMTDILSGVICEKHQYSIHELLEMKKNGWENVDDLIQLSEYSKITDEKANRNVRTPSKYIEVYELNGMMPSYWLGEEYEEYEEEFVRQIQVVSFYQSKEGQKKGITLFKSENKKNPYKFRTDPIHNRALGYGGVEELIEPQVWVNYGIIREKGLLDQASKLIYQTADGALTTRNKISNMENGDIIVHDGNPVVPINTTAPNLVLFERSIQDWEVHARQMSAATESLMGEQPSSGTPFKLQELITQTSMGLHNYRMGRNAEFTEEAYRDWIIPKMVQELLKGHKWIGELDKEELIEVGRQIVDNKANELAKEKILSGELVFPEDVQRFKQDALRAFFKKGNKQIFKVIKDEFKESEIQVKINIKGKQKDLAVMTDKIVRIFQTIMANPQGFIQMMQNPAMRKSFNDILEYSGLSPMDFKDLSDNMMMAPQPGAMPAGMEEMSKGQQMMQTTA